MIVRTYQRRSRTGRSLSDGGFGGESSQSQDSPWSSSQETFPLSQEAFPSSQESCWWQPESENWALPSGGLPDESTLTGFTRLRPPVWSNRQVENGSVITNVPPLSSQSSQDVNGDAFKEKLVLDSDAAADRFPNQRSELGGTGISSNSWGPTTPATATLLEAQESGELMAHMDEANFALDGLKPGQPLRVQRASLQSLLSLCGSMQRRRLLRTHGLVKPLFDSVVALPLDDPPLALAAAAVLYFLALDGQNEELFDSASCVRFLMGLLGSSLSRPANKTLSTVGNKLAGLAFRLKSGTVSSGVDKAGAAVVAEVHQLFSKDEKSPFGHLNKDETSGFLLGQEVSSKWLALLTVEKACISPVVLEDNSGAAQRMSGFFKERLRELGGLDTICDLAAACLRNIRVFIYDDHYLVSPLVVKLNGEGERLKTDDYGPRNTTKILEVPSLSPWPSQEALEAEEAEGGSKSRYFTALEKCEKNGGVGMLLRCLLVMENVTFLSEQNQRHLLELRLPRGSKDAPDTFIALIIATIKLLSELADCHKERKEIRDKCNMELRGAKAIKRTDKVTETSASSSLKSFGALNRSVFNEASQKGPGKALLRLKSEVHRRPSVGSSVENPLSKLKSAPPETLLSRSLLRISGTSSSGAQEAKPSSEALLLKRKESTPTDDSQDPFAFDDFELDFGSEKASKKRVRKVGLVEEASDTAKVSGRREPSDGQDSAVLRSAEDYREPIPHLAECLLSGVKVLMNLTNNNPVGCRQVANCGGLDAVSSLLVAYFPKPSVEALQVPGSSYGKSKGKDSDTDEDLEMVVVALGVLCNLVERDEGNRSRLATLNVDLPPHVAAKKGSVSSKYGMLSLLCALFLSKQGAGEAAEAAEAMEEKMLSEEDEEVNISEGEREAEDMIVEAYTAVLLAFLSLESDVVRLAIAQLLPGDDLSSLVPVMERFLAFHLSLNMLSAETHAAITEVIDSCQQPMPLRELLM